MNNIQSKNTPAVLAEILKSLEKAGDAIDNYFDHVDDGEIVNPFRTGVETGDPGKNETLPPEFFSGFGIQQLILDAPHGRLSLFEKDFIDSVERDAPSFRWHGPGADLIMDDLKTLFENSQVVEFKNWSDINNASDIWDNLRRDVIGSVRRRDFDFVFHLGNAAGKLGFEVDEFLDIVCGYAGFGRVTLVLDERSVDSLWEMFFGRNAHSEIPALPGLREKCRSLFELINIEHLIVASYSDTHFFYKQEQFEIEGLKGIPISETGRRHFNTGYVLGLLLKVNISHSIALGLAVAGLYSEIGNKPDGKNLAGYIKKWLGELESLKPMQNQLSVA